MSDAPTRETAASDPARQQRPDAPPAFAPYEGAALPAAAALAAVGDPRFSGPANRPRHTATVLNLQRDAGNAETWRLLTAPAVQRDGPEPPGLPARGVTGSATSSDMRLRLDPAIEAQLRAMQAARAIEVALQTDAVRLGLAALPLPVPPPNLVLPPAAGPAGTAAPPAAVSGPPPATPAPAVPAGAGPDTPRPATAGDLARAIMAVPMIDTAVSNLQQAAADRARADWRSLSTGEATAVVSATAVIALGGVAGALTSPEGRSWLRDQINGRTIPVPLIPGMAAEFRVGDSDLMVGLHLDVGRLLPASLGFGPSSPSALGGPPSAATPPWVGGQRALAPGEAAATADPSVGQRIAAASGGSTLDREARAPIERALGADLSGVRVHTDAAADGLARAVHARAFTTGRDIFFRAGAYAPDSHEGRRLLAHEAVHTVQQAAGPVAGQRTPDGVSISDPGDRFEQQAEQTARAIVAGWGNPEANLTDNGAASLDPPDAAAAAAGPRRLDGAPWEPGTGMPTAKLPVQRCGAEVHEGCACAMDTTNRPEPTYDQVFNVQRDTPGATTAPATASAAPSAAEREAIPADSPYAALPDPLKETLRASYRANTMRFVHPPEKTLVQVLDDLDMAALNAMRHVYDRMAGLGLWGFVRDIVWIWETTSKGFTFNANGDLRSAVNNSPRFCKEFVVVSVFYHGLSEMWREYVTPGEPGLHISPGEKPASVHIDMHQVAVPFLGGYCDYDVGATFSHWGDLASDDGSIFKRLQSAKWKADDLAPRLAEALKNHPGRAAAIRQDQTDLAATRTEIDEIMPNMRKLAIGGPGGGYEGELTANRTYGKAVQRIVTNVNRIEGNMPYHNEELPSGDSAPTTTPVDAGAPAGVP